jgi:hypothetical protein
MMTNYDLNIQKQKAKSSGFSSMYLMVSIFLSMLAFFIVLVSVSTINHSKKDAIIKDIHKTFGEKNFKQDLIDIKLSKNFQNLTSFSDLKPLITEYAIGKNKLNFDQVKQSQNFIQIILPMYKIFSGDGINPTKYGTDFLINLTEEMKSRKFYINCKMTIAIPYKDKNNISIQISNKRAANIAKKLVIRGFDECVISASIFPSKLENIYDDNIKIIFSE